MRDGERVSVVIPALNEAAAIGRVLGDIPPWVDEVIVVDDGSTDATAAAASSAGARVVREPKRGYGQACLAGIAAIGETDIVVFLDADYSDFPDRMDRLVDPIVEDRADMVLGRRVPVHGQRAFTPAQLFGTALACHLMRLFWGGRYRDMGPFRAIRYNSLRALRMTDTTYGWTVEMQVKALRAGLRIVETPVPYRRRIGESKISGTIRGTVGAGVKILGTIGRYLIAPPKIDHGQPERLIVFTRCPRPGNTKTRLIPALGPLRAAELQRRMTERTVRTARRWAEAGRREVEVRYAGGSRRAMRRWLGPGVRIAPQARGDLGRRMRMALHEAFDRGCRRSIVIGTDAPDVDTALLDEAASRLRDHDVVLGPSSDGGYWLIGMTRLHPLFDGVPWSTDAVLPTTLARAESLGLRVHLLPELDDVDRPDDLARVGAFFDPERPVVSVIVPARNEADTIEPAIESARADGIEIVVVDGQSDDGTLERVATMGITGISSEPGRARQQNLGAAKARADVLLFLHADTLLPAGYTADVFDALMDRSAVGGAFLWRTPGEGPYMRLAQSMVRARSLYAREPWGDQGLFVRREDFEAVGGFPDVPIAEDWSFVHALRRRGRLAIVERYVITSDRRYRTLGSLRSFLTNRLITMGCLAGVPRDLLARIY